ncbi:MAG: EAL domain-containing protein [Xanthomonadales bacterium]|nr:EAL domain-containing protein [Xanthomonadales bacterium]
MTEKRPVRLVLVSDSEEDARQLALILEMDGLAVDALRVETRDELLAALQSGDVDIVLSAYALRRFTAASALKIVRQGGTTPPFIVVDGPIGELNAVKLMRAGANDIILKDRLWSLATAVRRETTDAELRRQQGQLEGERRLANLMSNLPGMVFRLDVESQYRFLFASAGSRALVGQGHDELAGMPFIDVVYPEDRVSVREALDEAVAGDCQVTVEHRLRRGDRVIWVGTRVSPAEDTLTGQQVLECYAYDVSEQRRFRERLDYLAYHDTLTGLPNRPFFEEQFRRTIKQADRRDARLGLLFVDLDHFKEINDSLGHAAGDRLLKTVADRLRDSLRASDLVARLGGDEFVILVQDMSCNDDAGKLARKLLEKLCRSVTIDQHSVPVGASIGIACFPDDGRDPEVLLKNADAAMYAAKSSGRARYRFFADDMNARIRRMLDMRSAIPRALAQGELELYLQPQVDMTSGYIFGAEALLRWRHPHAGVLPASEIIPIAEELGLVEQIDDWVIDAGCSQLASWERQGLSHLKLAINVSAQRFCSAGLVRAFEDALARHGVPPERLTVEITESSLVADLDLPIENMRALTDLGLGLCMDDFGTGYASLHHLYRFPVTMLKIDQAFVAPLPGDPQSRRLTTAIIALARSLGLQVVAEGVERMAQRDLLIEFGCDAGQGLLLGQPVPAGDFLEMNKSTVPEHAVNQ